MFRASTLALLLSLPTGLLWGQENPQTPVLTHEVVRGETLWGLAERYLGNPFRWPMIFEANQAQIHNPDLIFPGQVLSIPGMDRVTARVEGVSVTVQGAETPVREDPQPPRAAAAQAGTRRTVFYEGSSSPLERGVPASEQPAEHTVGGETARLRAVPPGLIYGSEWLDPVRDEGGIGTLSGFSRVVADREPRGRARIGERMLVRIDPGVSLRLSRGDLLQSFRTVSRGDAMGSVRKPTGILVAMVVTDGAVEAAVSSEFDRVSEGDRVRLALETLPPVGVFPVPVESNLSARILGFATDRAMQGLGDRVFLDVGADQGIDIGDIFGAFPEAVGESAGPETVRLQVTLVEADRCTARVVSLTRPTLARGNVLHLVEKMPG